MIIVLIPGLMNDGWVWSGQIGPLSRAGQILVANNDGLDSLSAMAERILAATSGPLTAIGHSMGGRIALELYAQAPERVAKLVLLSTGAHGVRETEPAQRLPLVEIAEREGIAAVVPQWLPGMVGARGSKDEAVVSGITKMIERCTPSTFAGQQHALLTRQDRTGLLPSISCPTLVATGEEDRWATPEQHAGIARQIAGSRFETFDDAGHMLPVEAPDRLAASLLRFCQEA